MMKQDNRYFRPGVSMRRPHAVRLDERCERVSLEGARNVIVSACAQRTRITVSSEPARSCHILGMMSAHGSLPHT